MEYLRKIVKFRSCDCWVEYCTHPNKATTYMYIDSCIMHVYLDCPSRSYSTLISDLSLPFQCPIEWFHFACVGLTNKPKGKWFCPRCTSDRKKKLWQADTECLPRILSSWTPDSDTSTMAATGHPPWMTGWLTDTLGREELVRPTGAWLYRRVACVSVFKTAVTDCAGIVAMP